jgi:hypothetical protein
VPQPTVKQIRLSVLGLHRELLSAQVIELERATGRKMSPNETLSAALEDPRFAWLRELSSLVAEIDGDAAEAKSEGRELDLQPALVRLRSLVEPPDPDTQFGSRYLRALQETPAVVMAHRDLIRLLATTD